MSSATSTESSTPTSPVAAPDASLRPWQFFLLAGMLCATGVVIVATGQSPASIIVLSVTVVSASLVAMGAYRALAPLVGPEAALETPLIVGRTRAALEREKTLVLRSIKELEFDFAMGKISKSDFDDMSSRLRARAIGLMRQLDEGGGYKATIEQELQARLASGGRDFSPARTGATQVAPKRTEEPGAPKATPYACDSCGVVNDDDARFCKSCGTQLSAA
jgi:hypothetical protein